MKQYEYHLLAGDVVTHIGTLDAENEQQAEQQILAMKDKFFHSYFIEEVK